MSGYMFSLHKAIFMQHILMESIALCQLMSIVLIDVHRHSQFWCFEHVCSFSIFVFWLLSVTYNMFVSVVSLILGLSALMSKCCIFVLTCHSPGHVYLLLSWYDCSRLNFLPGSVCTSTYHKVHVLFGI